MGSTIKAYANCDHTYVVWRLDARVPGCRGFALRRRHHDGTVQVTGTWAGFAGQSAPPGTVKPSTEWPIQKFMWGDLGARPGDALAYQAVPMVGAAGSLTPDEDHATPWSEEVVTTVDPNATIQPYFNRGVVATQWLNRRLHAQAPGHEAASLRTEIGTSPASPIRTFLGGALRAQMLAMLTALQGNGGQVYAVLFELDDVELVPALVALGARAHVVLANGSKAGEDENADARATLKAADVEVHDRMVHSGHLAHNKFMVLCDSNGAPTHAWTGSTNVTKTGLCTQANNGILIRSADVAAQFRAQWDVLRDAADAYPDALFAANDVRKDAVVDGHDLDTWFVAVRQQVDLDDARALINGAKQGILFLMFNPGPQGTLLNAIVDRATQGTATFDPNLYIHGALNQDPSTSAHPIQLFHRGQQDDASFDVTLPEAVDAQLGFWVKELKQLPGTFAMIHSKIVLIDPFGDHPVLMTGSHNLGPKASSANDDNLIIVHDAPEVAAAYAVNIKGIYDQYRWRFLRTQNPTDDWTGLEDNDTWQDSYFTGAKARELGFWLGE